MTLSEEDDYQHGLMIPLMEEAIRDAVRAAIDAGLPITYGRRVGDVYEIVVEHNGEITVLKTITNKLSSSLKPGRYSFRRKD